MDRPAVQQCSSSSTDVDKCPYASQIAESGMGRLRNPLGAHAPAGCGKIEKTTLLMAVYLSGAESSGPLVLMHSDGNVRPYSPETDSDIPERVRGVWTWQPGSSNAHAHMALRRVVPEDTAFVNVFALVPLGLMAPRMLPQMGSTVSIFVVEAYTGTDGSPRRFALTHGASMETMRALFDSFMTRRRCPAAYSPVRIEIVYSHELEFVPLTTEDMDAFARLWTTSMRKVLRHVRVASSAVAAHVARIRDSL